MKKYILNICMLSKYDISDVDIINEVYNNNNNNLDITLFTTLISYEKNFEKLIQYNNINILSTCVPPNVKYIKGNKYYNIPYPTQTDIFNPYAYWQAPNSNPLETNFIIIKFKKPLSEIYLDTDAGDFSEIFGDEPYDETYDYIDEKISKDKDITIQELNNIQPIDNSTSFYGTFVKEIKPENYIDCLIYKNNSGRVKTNIKEADYILNMYDKIFKNAFNNDIDSIKNFDNKQIYYQNIINFINQPKIANYIKNCPKEVFNKLYSY